jgi:hypothetical protein
MSDSIAILGFLIMRAGTLTSRLTPSRTSPVIQSIAPQTHSAFTDFFHSLRDLLYSYPDELRASRFVAFMVRSAVFIEVIAGGEMDDRALRPVQEALTSHGLTRNARS